MLAESNHDLIDDLTKIVFSKYINKDNIEKVIKTKLADFYKSNQDTEKEEVLNIETETINN